jgi:hypothetical protein
MSDMNDFIDQGDSRETTPERWWGPAGLLTPPAAATTAFALAVFSMLGQGTWTTAVQSFFGTSFGPNDYSIILAATGVATGALALGALWLGRRVVTDGRAVASWEGHLARAAILVAALGAVLSILTIIGGVVQGA